MKFTRYKQIIERWPLVQDQNPLLGGDEASFLDTSIQLLFEGLSDGSTKSTFQIENAGNVRVDLIVSNSSYTLKLPLRFDVAKPETVIFLLFAN